MKLYWHPAMQVMYKVVLVILCNPSIFKKKNRGVRDFGQGGVTNTLWPCMLVTHYSKTLCTICPTNTATNPNLS
jgi:hypothetical protein